MRSYTRTQRLTPEPTQELAPILVPILGSDSATNGGGNVEVVGRAMSAHRVHEQPFSDFETIDEFGFEPGSIMIYFIGVPLSPGSL
jgi:hypothetical protein